MKFGVNYVPSKNWFYSYDDINFNNIKEDFSSIKNLGADHIRMHLRWDLFQPNQSYVSKKMLENLSKMIDIAYENSLDVYVSLFTGWMSGFWFLPSFTYNFHLIKDAEAIAFEKLYLDELSKVLMPLKAFKGIDLGNEFNMYDYYKHFDIEDGDKWLNNIMHYAKSIFPNKLVTIGVDHQPWFNDIEFSRGQLANLGTHTSLHTWIAFTGATSYGATSDEVMHLQEFNIELANAYSNDLDKPVWVQEFGVHNSWMKESEFEFFINNTMNYALRSENLWGFTWWCSHDVDKRLKGFNNLEYDLGLLTIDNKVKPLGKYFSKCINDIKDCDVKCNLKNDVAIVIDESKSFDGWDYGHKFINLIHDNVHAKFILSSKIKDKDYLAKRNIRELIY